MAAGDLAGLDRKAMEEARLARLGVKRERSISPPAGRDARKAPRLDVQESTVSLPSGAKLKSFSSTVDGEQRGRKSQSANAASQHLKQPHGTSEPSTHPEITMSEHNSLQYPTGIVKRTWAFGFERSGDDVKLEEVLEPGTLRTAVLSAFQWDADWVLSKLKLPPNGGITKVILVMQAKEDSLRRQMIEQTKDASYYLRLCFPRMDGQIWCMHSKLMLLFHPDKLRVAIPTANLLNFDWGETGVMENSVFMIDLPRLPDGSNVDATERNAFCNELLYFLEKQDLDEDIMTGVLNFDFSATDGMAFVHTFGGTNLGDDAGRTGLSGLARAVRQLKLQSDSRLEIDFASSSAGALNDDQLRNMHAAARGVDMIQRANGATSKAKLDFFKPAATKSASSEVSIGDKVRIYFPTYETVRASRAGAAGTICFSRKWWEEMKFPRNSFRDYQSTRSGLLSHNKILYARGKQQSVDGASRDVAWVYVGSANVSESAWGKLGHDNKAKGWKTNCRNWECGVLLPVREEKLAQFSNQESKEIVKKEKVAGEDSETESEDEAVAEGNTTSSKIMEIEVFDDLFKPPFQIPGQAYGDREPWYFQEYQ